MDILRTILAERKKDVADARRRVPLGDLRELAKERRHHGLAAKLSQSGTHVIAEMKKASPSAGLLREGYHPADIARLYEQGGAAGISVLTEPHRFLGSEQDLRDVRRTVELPVLRKDFILDPYQLYETAAWGADVLLLIAAALDRSLLRDLYDEATEIGLETLAEAHTAAELEVVLGLESAVVGVNSRNLKTLETDLSVVKDLASGIPGERLSIAESGIKQRQDVEELEAAGYNGFLVGEVLVSHETPAAKLRELISPATG